MALPTALSKLLPADRIRDETSVRQLFAQDVYRRGELPLAVVSPRSTEEVSKVLAAATEAGCAVFVRGGGMSYTDAFLPDREASIILDLSGLNAIRRIEADDLYVTVEAGCTWEQLDEALVPHGVRPIFWGPMSGSLSTVGGAMSQGAATFGSGRNGVSAAAALGFEIVAADGTVIKTGSDAQPHHTPFFRHYGPDLTGLFTGDAGALGVKTAVTLQLEPRPGHSSGLTFGFDTYRDLVAGVRRVARSGAATEVFGAESALARKVADASTFKGDLKTLLSVGRAAGNPITGIGRMLSIAANGRRFLDRSQYSVSFLTEGFSAAELRQNLKRIRAAAGSTGYEIANTMATVTRATPFPPPAVLGPGGLRLLPLNTIVPYSAAEGLHTEMNDLLEAHRQEFESLGIEVYLVYATTGRSGFLYELVIYWPDEWLELHRETMPAAFLEHMQEQPPQPDVQQRVDELKHSLVDVMYRHGGVHLQIGRCYPYTQERDAGALNLLRQLKNQLDPRGLINPGALGLE
ncbi:MAG: FAD-binding oxidoreductase [Pseudomonadota bacterium]